MEERGGPRRVLTGFGEAVADLSEDVLGVFDRDTQAFAVSPLRPKRHAELKRVLDKGVTTLVRKQLANLRGQGMRRFKAGLVKAVGRENHEDEEILVQKAQEQWFEAQAKGVVVPGVSGSYEKDKDDFVNDMVRERRLFRCELRTTHGGPPLARAVSPERLCPNDRPSSSVTHKA